MVRITVFVRVRVTVRARLGFNMNVCKIISNCNRFDKFEVGRGSTVGEQVFMSVIRTQEIWHHVAEVGFSTGYGHDGTWKVPENQGSMFAFSLYQAVKIIL